MRCLLSLVGHLLPEFVDLILFGLELQFFLLEHLVKGLDCLIGCVSHFLALLRVGTLELDPLLLDHIFHMLLTAYDILISCTPVINFTYDAFFVSHQLCQFLVFTPETLNLTLQRRIRVNPSSEGLRSSLRTLKDATIREVVTSVLLL